MAPSSLLSTVARQFISSAGLPSLSGSAMVCHPAPRDSTPPASPRPFGSTRLLHPLGSSSLLCSSGSTPPRRQHLIRLAPPDPPRYPCSSALRLSLGLLLHLLHHRWSASWSPPPWLHPPAGPPWATVVAVAWVPPCSSCSGSLTSLPWLFPPSSLPWTPGGSSSS